MNQGDDLFGEEGNSKNVFCQLGKQEEELNELYSNTLEELQEKLDLKKKMLISAEDSENIELLEKKIEYTMELRQGFFSYIWEKIKEAFNFVADLVCAFVDKVLSLLDFSLKELSVSGGGKISNSSGLDLNFNAHL